MLLYLDYSTFSKKSDKPISTTRVGILCDNCNEVFWETNFECYSSFIDKPDFCTSCKNKLGISGMSGKKHSEETKQLWKENKRGIGDKNGSKKEGVGNKISKALKGRDAYWMKGKKRPSHSKRMKEFMNQVWNKEGFREEYKEKLISSHNSSKSHIRFKEYFFNILKDFKTETPIEGTKFIVDECDLENKLIIEFNGDFWHANPLFYNSIDSIYQPGKKSQKVYEIWKKDNYRRLVLKKLGYQILIIWESDFLKDKVFVKKQLEEFIKNGKS